VAINRNRSDTMNRLIRRPLLAGALLSLSTLALAGAAVQEIDATNDPVWSAGGHYTAELDLRAARLNLFPLNGTDQQLNLRDACAPGREVAAGVYLLVAAGQGYQLMRTTPHGQPQVLGSDQIRLTDCDDHAAPRSALRVPADVLHAFERAAVGAVYVH
jgi:hypothetical protein